MKRYLRLISLFIIVLIASVSYATTFPGDKATVGKDTYIATDVAAYDELMKIADARDTYGLAQLMVSGRVYEIDKGTIVLVIESDAWEGRTRIRITEGKLKGLSGWIVTKMLR